MKSKKLIILGLVILIATGIVGAFVFRTPEARIAVFRHPLIQYTLPTYRSLRKVLDLPYAWYKLFGDDLPTYAIMLRAEDIALMNAALPEDNFKGRLTDDNKVKVRADFYAKDYEDRIRIRYRGRGPNHWNAFKKSFHMDFDAENPFNGYTAIKFIIPEDRNYAIVPMNAHRAEKLGIFAPQPWFAKLEISEQDMGVYIALPHWSTSLLEHNGFPETSNIFGIIDFELSELQDRNFFDPKEFQNWEDYTRNADINSDDFRSLQDFLALLNAPDETYKNTLPALVDMDSLYSWLILNALASSSHQNATVNIVLARDASTGKFQPIPWDVQIFKPRHMSLEYHPLIGRTLAIPEFRQEFLSRLTTYVSEENLSDDLAFYDQTTELIHTAVMKDDAKLPLNYQVNKKIDELRQNMKDNFMFISDILKKNREELFVGEFKTEPVAPDLSKIYKESQKTIYSFVAQHPQFYAIDQKTLGIGPGTISIPSTTILPTETTLVVKPGTTVLLGNKASLVGWKNIIAKGTKSSPITFQGSSINPWGNILMLGDSSVTSEFDYITARGGSGFHEYNITATGMIAIHKSNAIVTNSHFEDSYDDDALNIKFGHVDINNNSFKNTLSDGIDIDSGIGSVTGNTFSDIGGDGIDISLSTLDIRGNTVDSCADKGISVGEQSYPTIDNNSISNCAIGISSKDLSQATITNTILSSNIIGIEAKQKKPIFGGGHAVVRNSKFIENTNNFLIVDDQSTITEDNNEY